MDSPVRVIEGDTLEVRIDGRRIGVLIAGIVAPQGNTACGRRAITTTQALVEGGITLHEDLTLPPFDRRLLRVYRVFDAMGRLVAAELARAGLAVPADGMSNGVDRPAIAAAAADAAANRRTCVTPSHR